MFAPESLSGNSLDKATRSLTNFGGESGQSAWGEGMGTTRKGLDYAQPALDFFTRLLNGDRGEMMAATAPVTDPIHQQFSQIRQMFSHNGQRGGGTASTLAQAPQQEIATVSDIINGARNNAAGQQGGLAMDVARTGLAQAGEGAGMMGNTVNAYMGRRGQNLQERGQNFGTFVSPFINQAAEAAGDFGSAKLFKMFF